MNKKVVAIIGFGYVGKVLANFFRDHFTVLVYDPFIEAIPDSNTHPNVSLVKEKNEVSKADLAIISVPTPMADDASVDLSLIEEVIGWLDTPLILLKSTVPPGTVKKLVEKTGKNIAFSPEYVGESSYVTQWWKDRGYADPHDMKHHDFQIFGGKKETTKAILQFFKKVMGPQIIYAQTDSTTAELTKYMENAWGATKVTFCNEFANMAEAFSVDYDELRELWLLDGRIERMHTAVFMDKRGFGGKCFPKDTNGIVQQSIQAGYEPAFLKSVLENNEKFLKQNEKQKNNNK